MKPPCRHIRLQGRGAEKQLTRLQNMGCTLYDIQKTAPDTLEIGFPASCADSVIPFLTARGFSVVPLPPRGTARQLHTARQHLSLVLFFAAALLALYLSTRCIWRIEITGAGAYAGEVRTFLLEENISAGRLISAIDLNTLEQKLTYRLPRVAWVRIYRQGLTLHIDITEGMPQPLTADDGQNGDLIAARDGVIASVSVYAGTAAVQPGDTVKAGDVLIYGYERRENETACAVHARGKITARTYLSETVRLSAETYQSIRTGCSSNTCWLHFPFFSLPLSPAPAYLTSEYESDFIPVGGAWFPLEIEKRTVFEVYLQREKADESALREEAYRLCLQNLLPQCAKDDEIIDKWLYYSMIEGGILSATVILEVLADIGLFSPETPE